MREINVNQLTANCQKGAAIIVSFFSHITSIPTFSIFFYFYFFRGEKRKLAREQNFHECPVTFRIQIWIVQFSAEYPSGLKIKSFPQIQAPKYYLFLIKMCNEYC